MTVMPASSLLALLLERIPGLIATPSWGETSLFYNPGSVLARGVYLATIKEKDGPNVKASDLDRDQVYRFNCGLVRKDFESLFGKPPTRPGKGQVIAGPWDFRELDQLMPHPIFGWMSWVAILNPTEQSFESLRPYLDRAHEKAKMNFEQRIKKLGG